MTRIVEIGNTKSIDILMNLEELSLFPQQIFYSSKSEL